MLETGALSGKIYFTVLCVFGFAQFIVVRYLKRIDDGISKIVEVEKRLIIVEERQNHIMREHEKNHE